MLGIALCHGRKHGTILYPQIRNNIIAGLALIYPKSSKDELEKILDGIEWLYVDNDPNVWPDMEYDFIQGPIIFQNEDDDENVLVDVIISMFCPVENIRGGQHRILIHHLLRTLNYNIKVGGLAIWPEGLAKLRMFYFDDLDSYRRNFYNLIFHYGFSIQPGKISFHDNSICMIKEKPSADTDFIIPQI